MKKVAVVTDSNSGITQREAPELQVHVLPMPFFMDGETYFEDINLTQELFYQKLAEGAQISTSQPAIGAIMELWNRLLEEYEEVVHIPMSSGLSTSYESAMVLAQEYDGKVQVVNNQRISETQRQSALDAITLADAGWSALQIKEYLEQVKFESSIYIMLGTLKYIRKGGRITPAAAAMGSVLNIKPVLQIQGEKLDSYAKVRGVKKGRRTLIDAMRNDFDSRFAGYAGPEHMWLFIAYSHDKEAALDFKKEVEEAFPGYEIHMSPLSLSVACHIGHGALAVLCSKKLDSSMLGGPYKNE